MKDGGQWRNTLLQASLAHASFCPIWGGIHAQDLFEERALNRALSQTIKKRGPTKVVGRGN
jgi:hypothetical protein